MKLVGVSLAEQRLITRSLLASHGQYRYPSPRTLEPTHRPQFQSLNCGMPGDTPSYCEENGLQLRAVDSFVGAIERRCEDSYGA
jgi:hypothetical protein